MNPLPLPAAALPEAPLALGGGVRLEPARVVVRGVAIEWAEPFAATLSWTMKRRGRRRVEHWLHLELDQASSDGLTRRRVSLGVASGVALAWLHVDLPTRAGRPDTMLAPDAFERVLAAARLAMQTAGEERWVPRGCALPDEHPLVRLQRRPLPGLVPLGTRGHHWLARRAGARAGLALLGEASVVALAASFVALLVTLYTVAAFSPAMNGWLAFAIWLLVTCAQMVAWGAWKHQAWMRLTTHDVELGSVRLLRSEVSGIAVLHVPNLERERVCLALMRGTAVTLTAFAADHAHGVAVALREAWGLPIPRRLRDVPPLERPAWLRRHDPALLDALDVWLVGEAALVDGLVLTAETIATWDWIRTDLRRVAARPFLLESVPGLPRYQRLCHERLALIVPAADALPLTDLLDAHARAADDAVTREPGTGQSSPGRASATRSHPP